MILDFGRFEESKNPFSNNSSGKPQMVRFVLVTAISSLTCQFELNTTILDFGRFEVRKNSIFQKSSKRPQIVRLVVVTLRAAQPANLSSIRLL